MNESYPDGLYGPLIITPTGGEPYANSYNDDHTFMIAGKLDMAVPFAAAVNQIYLLTVCADYYSLTVRAFTRGIISLHDV